MSKSDPDVERESKIRTRAYFLWENRTGRTWWNDFDNWIQAEYEEDLLSIADMMKPFVASVLIVPEHSPYPNSIEAGGSAGLIFTGEKRLLITAKHVTDAAFRKGKLALLAAGNGCSPIDISSWQIIDQHDYLDVAVIDVPSEFDPTSIQRAFCGIGTWPPPRANRDDIAGFLGYAGKDRRLLDDGDLLLGLTPFCDRVSESSDRQFILADEDGGRVIARYLPDVPGFGSTGGLSGSLVFINRSGALLPAGTVRAADDTERATFFVAHLDYIKRDGSIDSLRLPE